MPDIFVWNKDYSVGVENFDKQHQHFFDIVNSIYKAVNEIPLNKETLLNLATKLGNYALYHLDSEEKNFLKYGYPNKDLHILIHATFRNRVQDYIDQLSSDHVVIEDVAKSMADFAKNWLAYHILTVDKTYSDFFVGKQIID